MRELDDRLGAGTGDHLGDRCCAGPERRSTVAWTVWVGGSGIDGPLERGGGYFAVYLGIRSLLEGPRLILEQLSGAAVRISPMWTGLLALLVIFYLDL